MNQRYTDGKAKANTLPYYFYCMLTVSHLSALTKAICLQFLQALWASIYSLCKLPRLCKAAPEMQTFLPSCTITATSWPVGQQCYWDHLPHASHSSKRKNPTADTYGPWGAVLALLESTGHLGFAWGSGEPSPVFPPRGRSWTRSPAADQHLTSHCHHAGQAQGGRQCQNCWKQHHTSLHLQGEGRFS